MKVLVAEKIGASGIELLRDAGLEVELGTGWDRAELERRIADYDGVLIRSATQVDADLLAKADRLRVVAR
ncbi:MAG: phosphoglycerate dehydrogenase, partial [Pseudonocardiales bacterium]